MTNCALEYASWKHVVHRAYIPGIQDYLRKGEATGWQVVGVFPDDMSKFHVNLIWKKMRTVHDADPELYTP
jgi:hypothetical protein